MYAFWSKTTRKPKDVTPKTKNVDKWKEHHNAFCGYTLLPQLSNNRTLIQKNNPRFSGPFGFEKITCCLILKKALISKNRKTSFIWDTVLCVCFFPQKNSEKAFTYLVVIPWLIICVAGEQDRAHIINSLKQSVVGCYSSGPRRSQGGAQGPAPPQLKYYQ